MEEGKGERYLASGRQYGNALLGVRNQEESCLHVVNNFLRLPEPDKNMVYLSPYHWPVLKFSKIPQKRRNAVETGKFRGSAQNSTFCKKLWSLLMYHQLASE